ncbi:MAG: hypothetical protein V1245_01015 [Arenicellales bacterium]|nr:hypothetical protein [Arenicellales bacterium]MEE1557961.1 hypothetical protein [Arenicellales bacterium]HJP44443.1 hypothetical protein [Arenicellales bacterium]|tara:strand:+ start:9914 stop:10441 length:528 start_codon:yes stop_codon:yes gene_type:complete
MCRAAALLGAAWGFLGMAALLWFAIWRLTVLACEGYQIGYEGRHWVLLIINTLFMAYSEGYRGFQQAFSPRFAARLRYLLRHPKPTHLLLAPLFCAGFFFTTRRRKLSAYLLTLAIVSLVLLVQQLDQPWRGAIDVGVVLGLTWGVVSLAASCTNALRLPHYPPSPELPEVQSNS